MAYRTYLPQIPKCQDSVDFTGEEQHPRPLVKLRQPKFRQMSEMQLGPVQKELSPTEYPQEGINEKSNIMVRHLRPPRPLLQSLEECKKDALTPPSQDENAPMQKLRKPHPISADSQKQKSRSQQFRLQQPISEKVHTTSEQQSKQPQPSPDQQGQSGKQKQTLPKQLKPVPSQQELSLQNQQSASKLLEPIKKQHQSMPKQVQPSQSLQQLSSKEHQSSLHPLLVSEPQVKVTESKLKKHSISVKTNNDDMNTDSSTSEKPSSGNILAVKRKKPKSARRRFTNAELRKLLQPRNAVSVLNEVLPHHLAELKVKPISCNDTNSMNFHATLIIDGVLYEGFGINKTAARMAVAEQVFQDFIFEQMCKQSEDNAEETQHGEGEEGALPMVQLASYALHKLFSQWEGAGYKVPPL